MKIISIPQLGRILLDGRKEKGLKQKEVLEQVNVGRTTLSKLENGLCEHIDMAIIFQLLSLYGLSLDVSPSQLNQRLRTRSKAGRS